MTLAKEIADLLNIYKSLQPYNLDNSPILKSLLINQGEVFIDEHNNLWSMSEWIRHGSILKMREEGRRKIAKERLSQVEVTNNLFEELEAKLKLKEKELNANR